MRKQSRRHFLKSTSASVGGLILGFHLPFRENAQAARLDSATVNAWVRIAKDGTTTLYMNQAEMGQGVYTALPQILADEAELDWQKVRVEFAPSTAEYIMVKNPGTGASKSIRVGFEAMRNAGASVREMMTAAAAEKWRVPKDSLVCRSGKVLHPSSKRQASYGSLASAAARQSAPQQPKLKSATDFRLIGKSLPRLDIPSKVKGQAIYGIDVSVPGMLYAAVRTAPVFGGDLVNFDQLVTAKPTAIEAIVKIPGGVAVVADSYWRAQRALDTMDLHFTPGPLADLNAEAIQKTLTQGFEQKGVLVKNVGDIEKASSRKHTKVKGEYRVPFLAHNTLEPMNCTARVDKDRCELWVPTQTRLNTKVSAANALGIPADNVTVHSTYVGCGFGRRLERDFVVQAVLIAKAVNKTIKLIWSREEDIQHDFYRPACAARFQAELDADGFPVTLDWHLASDSILSRYAPQRIENGIDSFAADGLREPFYAIANYRFTHHPTKSGVPVGLWRSVGYSHNAFFLENAINELARTARIDPLEYRRRLLAKRPRTLAVMNQVAEMSSWQANVKDPTRYLGLAVVECFSSSVAEVVEVYKLQDDTIKIKNVWVAVDCGLTVNPAIAIAQVQGGVLFGLEAALYGEVQIQQGRVQNKGFEDYRLLRNGEDPSVTVHLMPSSESPGGIGEVGVPALAPALAAAIYSATKTKITSLPIEKYDFSKTTAT